MLKKKYVHMHKRVGFKEANRKEVAQISRGSSSKIDKTSIHGSASNEALYSRTDNYNKYKPLITALPQTMGSPPTIAERIRAAKKLHMTRRDMTEQKIIKNIIMHNDPSDLQNFEVLYISNKHDRLMEHNAYHQKSRNEFPILNHITR